MVSLLVVSVEQNLMNSQKNDIDLFSTPQEKAEKLDLDLRKLTNTEITDLCECPDILLKKLQNSVADVTLPEFQNTTNIIKELLEQRKRLAKIVSSLTRCRRCGYNSFIVPSGGSSPCPKCGVVHLAP